MRQIDRLNSGQVAYKALDGGFRPEGSNCIHAVADVDTDRGFLHLGRTFGAAASAEIVEHLKPGIIEPEKLHPSINEKLGLAKPRAANAEEPVVQP